MGFYDTTCLLTGINVRMIDATVVLMRRVDTTYQPISLGISGDYDGYGCIEGVQTDRNTELLTHYFTAAHRAGRFQAADQTHSDDPDWFDPVIEIESLLFLVERTNSCSDRFGGYGPPSTLLDGHDVVSAMISGPVWQALTSQRRRGGPRSGRTLLDDAFGAGASIAAQIYGEHLSDATIVEQMRELAAITDFITTHPPLRWAPPGEAEQRYPLSYGQFADNENRAFVETARQDYRDDPAIQDALDEYVRRTG